MLVSKEIKKLIDWIFNFWAFQLLCSQKHFASVTDLNYAQEIYEDFIKQVETENVTSDYCENQDKETSNEKVWTKKNTLFFIRQYQSADEEGDITKEVWTRIANSCSEAFGKEVSFKACSEKWKSLKRTYKTIKLKNSQSGNKRRYWEYYDLIDSFMAKKPEIQPVATCSNLGSLQTSTDQVPEDSEEPGTSSSSTETSVSRKRKQRVKDSDRRHQEKLARMDRFNNLFQQMIDKL